MKSAAAHVDNSNTFWRKLLRSDEIKLDYLFTMTTGLCRGVNVAP